MPSDQLAGAYFSPDIQEFFRLLANRGVRYLLVGGEAVIYYGHVRFTGDVDFFYEAEPNNVRQLFSALEEFWDGRVPGISAPIDLLEDGVIVQFGRPPHRIDLLNRIDGVTFAEAWPRRKEVNLQLPHENVSIYYISLDKLIQNKAKAARPKDLDDLQYLQCIFGGSA
jgi:predicted nucleotidyltransferase